jgi:biotin carboxylase/drug/metabolite transporter (DMT)-like permease
MRPTDLKATDQAEPTDSAGRGGTPRRQAHRAPDKLFGIAAVTAFAFLTAVVDVYAGERFQQISPVSAAAVSFTITAAVVILVEALRRGAAAFRPLITRRYDVVAINITTAFTWLGMLWSLKYIEPAIVNVLSLAIGPVVIVAAGSLIRRGSSLLRLEAVASVGILLVIGILTWGTIAGRSAVGEVDVGESVLGIGLAVGSGVASAGNLLYSKRLSEAGLTPRSVLAVRFYLMVIVSWVIVAVSYDPGLRDAVVPGLVLAVISVALPLYLLQVGVKHIEPITVSLLTCLGPGFTLLLQLFDMRLRVSWFSIISITIVTILVAVAIAARQRSDSRDVRDAGSRPPRCAIVDCYSTGGYLPAEMRKHGMDSVHVRSQHPDVHLTPQSEGFVDTIFHEGDIGGTVNRLRRLGVGEVVAGAESGVELADLLACRLNVPGNGMRRPHSRRNKYEMAVALREHGIVAPATIESDSAEEIVAWADAHGHWPVVLKPLCSAGTDNVIFCADPDEIRAAHAMITASRDRYGTRNERVLAQEFLAGDEYFVNTVSRNGRHRTVEIWRYYKRATTDGHILYDYEEPVPHDHPDTLRVEAYTYQVLEALEIRNGAAHSELMLTERGPVLIECGARMGGSQVPEIASECLGTNQVEILALAVARPDEFARLAGAPYRLLQQLRYVSLINPRGGVMPSWDELEAIRRLPSYRHAVLTVPAGASLPRTIDVATSPGFVYLVAEDRDQILADYEALRRLELEGLYEAGRPVDMPALPADHDLPSRRTVT